jgi:hypothetical protein
VITVRNGIFYGFLIILFAALVTHTGRSGGGTSAGGGTGGGTAANTGSGRSLADALAGGAGVYCTILADAVRHDSAGKRIVAPGRFRCDRPGADTLTMTVALQKLGANGAWSNVAVQQFGAKGASTTRDLSEAQRTREVGAPCAAGTYRTAVSATRTSSQTSKQYAMQSPSRVNPCGR